LCRRKGLNMNKPLLVLSTLLIVLSQVACSNTPQVVANGESLIGQYNQQQPSVAEYLGVPFAKPPVAISRWQAPQPQSTRSGPQSAKSFAAGCYQDSYNSDWYRDIVKAFGADPSVISDPEFSEDCLYLNIWTPAKNTQDNLPVMVWIHGGSNKAGWSFEPNYRGANLAKHGDVIVISIAYRLGVFGFFNHPELLDQNEPINFGLLDQISALTWIKDNVKNFGGNPNNITLFGESAGAADIGYLMSSPLTKGLFNRAISQSGGFQLQVSTTAEQSAELGSKLQSSLKSKPKNLFEMKAIAADEIFTTAKNALSAHYYSPAIDGISLTQTSYQYLLKNTVDVDLLVGHNQNEWYMYLDNDAAELGKYVQGSAPAIQEQLTNRAAEAASIRHGHDKISTLVDMTCSAYEMASHTQQSNKQAWVYKFTRVRPGTGGQTLLSYHGAEIPYVFDSHDNWLSTDAADRSLSRKMMSYWSNFARNGNPNGNGLPAWESFSAAQPSVLQLGDQTLSIPAPDHALCQNVAQHSYP